MSEGRVLVNGTPVRELGTRVDPVHDAVMFDGRPVRVRRKIYLALHKPLGVLCTRRVEASRRTVFDLIPAEWGHLHTVGRLDRDSEGLIFLTNDGEFSLRLTHPRYGKKKHYRVTVAGRLAPGTLRHLERGVTHTGEMLRAESARLVDSNNTRSVVEVVLAEGKNREIRRLFESQNILVTRLERWQIGSIKLGELRAGRWRTLTEAEIKSLLTQQ